LVTPFSSTSSNALHTVHPSLLHFSNAGSFQRKLVNSSIVMRSALFGAFVLFGIGCAQSSGSLVATTSEPEGMNCPTGGQRVTAGSDLDNDGTLSAAEVKSTVYICNGTNGTNGQAGREGENALVTLTEEAPGMNCPNGGSAVKTGLDDNRNGMLEPAEVDSTRYVCSGAAAFALLSQASAEQAGANCASGGLRLVVGLDNGDGGGTPGNGTLETGEVDSTSYVCNGGAGLSTLVSVSAETPGTNCATGGQRLNVGLDNGDGGGTANNGTLEAGEVDGTFYVCTGAAGVAGPPGDAGAPGAAGFASLVTITPEPVGANCASAGQRVAQGLDNGDGGGTARNGTLESGEIDSTRYLCESTPTVAEVCRVPQFRFGTTVEVIHTAPDKTTEALVLVRLDTRALITDQPARMRVDCADLRVVDLSGAALRHHVVVGTCNTTNTQVLVRLPAGVRFGTQRIVVQYGNATAATAAESTAVFVASAPVFTETFESGLGAWTSAAFNGPDSSESSSAAVDPSVPASGGTQSARLRTDASCSLPPFNGMGVGLSRTLNLPTATYLVVADQRTQITGFTFSSSAAQISAVALSSTTGPTTGVEVSRLDVGCSGFSCTVPGSWTTIGGVAVGVPLTTLILRTLSTDCADGNAYFDNVNVYTLPDDGKTFSRTNGFQQSCP
jgi:hypothetical protein